MSDTVYPIAVFIFLFFASSAIFSIMSTPTEKPSTMWMTVDDHSRGTTSRLKVPGGYLYRETLHGESVSICFVPEVAAERS